MCLGLDFFFYFCESDSMKGLRNYKLKSNFYETIVINTATCS